MGNIHGGKLGSKRICLGVQIKKETHAELLEIAREMELTLSDIVRFAIIDYIKKRGS